MKKKKHIHTVISIVRDLWNLCLWDEHLWHLFSRTEPTLVCSFLLLLWWTSRISTHVQRYDIIRLKMTRSRIKSRQVESVRAFELVRGHTHFLHANTHHFKKKKEKTIFFSFEYLSSKHTCNTDIFSCSILILKEFFSLCNFKSTIDCIDHVKFSWYFLLIAYYELLWLMNICLNS